MQLIFIGNKAIPADNVSYVDFNAAMYGIDKRYIMVHLRDHTQFRVTDVEQMKVLIKIFVPQNLQLQFIDRVELIKV